jgi:hypothetical protein
MICDFCYQWISPEADYYILKISECNIKELREDNYDVWVVCKECFEKIKKIWMGCSKRKQNG